MQHQCEMKQFDDWLTTLAYCRKERERDNVDAFQSTLPQGNNKYKGVEF